MKIPIQRCIVHDAWVDLPDRSDTAYMDIVSCSFSYVLNQIPEATVTPALGIPLFRPASVESKRIAFKDIQKGERAVIKVELTYQDSRDVYELFHGYIQSVQPSDSGTLFNRTQEATVTLRHRISDLSGPPPASYTYTKAGNYLHAVQTDTAAASMVGEPAGASAVPVANLLARLREQGRPTTNPGVLYKSIITFLARNYGALFKEFDVQEYIKTFDGASMDKKVLDPDSLNLAWAPAFVDSWQQNSVLSALTSAVQEVYMSIIPYASGLWIANPLSMIREPAVLLGLSDYTAVQAQTISVVVPEDGVAVKVPVVSAENNTPVQIASGGFIFWPQDANGGTLAGKFYHNRPFPSWMYQFASRYSGAPKTPKEAAGERSATTPTSLEKLGALVNRMIESVAKTEYGIMQAKGQLRITLPFRMDLSPGTIIRLDATGRSSISFLGDYLYGMLMSVNYSLSNAEGQQNIAVTVDVAAVRNTAQNYNDALTYPEHPIYDANWPGCRLDGTLLE